MENATLLKGAERSQVTGSKYKEIASMNEKGHQPSKKAKGKYCRDNAVKIGVLTPVRDVCIPGRISWCTIQDE